MKRFLLLVFVLPVWVMAQTTLPAFWNFSSPGIASPPNGWITGLGSNGNLTYSGSGNSVGGDGIACRLDAIGEYLTIWFADKPGALSYWLRGTGISPAPAFTGSFIVQESVDGNSWSDMRTFTTAAPAPSTMTRFVNNPAPTSRYIRFFYGAKESGSNIALDSVLLTAAPQATTATINLKQGSKTVVNNTTYVVGKSTSTTFTVENKGSVETLTISGIALSGDNAQDFAIVGAPASVAPNSSATFQITFSPGNMGTHKADLSITSNDADKSVYLVNLYGIGGDFASEPTEQPSNFTATNLKPYTVNCAFSKPQESAESFLVLRKNGTITEIPVDGHTYQRGDYIGNAVVAYVGSDTAFKPTYIFANTPYSFAVFSFNGPATFENYLTTAPLKQTVTTPNGNPANYYNGISADNANLLSLLKAKGYPHDTVFYSQYIGTIINSFLTRDTTGGKKVVNCVYTSNPYIYDEPFLWWTGTNSAILTREHTFAQSWMPSRSLPTWPNAANGKEVPEYNDLHHLFPADQELGNVKRSNYPFGEVVTPTYVSPTGQGKLGTDANGKMVWEPRDEQKGDLARAMFYMCVTYNGVNGNNWSLGAIGVAAQNDSILKKWHFQDLPDAYEIARHEYIASLQHNRNPFIDSVNFACRINFNNLTWIANPDPNCGVVVPALNLTSPVGGEVWEFSMPGGGGIVSWTSDNIDSVHIELFVEDSLFSNIGTFSADLDSINAFVFPIAVSTTKAKIKLTATDHSLTSMSPNYFTIRNTIGINDALQANALLVYPNPSNGTATIELKDLGVRFGSLSVIDIAGRVVLEKNIQQQTSLELPQKGVYFIKLQTEKGSVVKKLIVN